MNGISSVEAFYRGLKPALFATSKQEKFMSDVYPSIIKEFPYIDQGIQLIKDSDCYLFFQSEKDKQEFLHRIDGLTPEEPEFHRVFGLTLGYPPKAVDFYVKKKRGQSNEAGVALYYCGQSVINPIDDLLSNVQWLWDTYQFPESLYVGYVKNKLWTTTEVEYRDLDGLMKVKNQIIEIRNKEVG